MPDRIFTTQQQESLGPTEVINGLDYNKVASMLQEVTGESVPAASEPLIGFAALVQAEKKPETPMEAEAGAGCCEPKAARKIAKDGTCPACSKRMPCACKMAEAAMAGDDVSLGIMAEIRNQRRYAMLKRNEEQARIIAAQQQIVQQRVAERQAIAEGLDALEQAIVAVPEDKSTPVASSDPKFQSVDELTASQKDRFAKWAEKQGWPAQYVEAFVTPKTVEAEADPFVDSIMVVASRSDLAAEVRQGLIEAMCKEAKLKPEQAARVSKYWSSEVGLPSDWVSKLVTEPDIK